MKLAMYFAAAALASSSTAAFAQGWADNDPAPGAASLMSSNFATAEREIRSANVSKYDPAASINLGVALAKQGKRAEASELFNLVLAAEDVEMVVANGDTVMSHDLARRALASLEHGVLRY